ncbi:Sodium- and chloride-dependent glycine transporter 1 [Halotydeus destructor]|nr:Sodium- and chloride-dependent glycine transporter 1 [Halotydeus destructor]
MQIFFSLSPCWGGLITLASYNRFHNNCLKDSLVIAIGNCLTSFFAGFVIFGIVGFMAHELGVPVSEVAAQGAGLAFVAYPEAVARLPISPVWSFMFFFMLLTLGLGTQFTLIETVVTTITDTFQDRLRHRKPMVLMAVCTFMYFAGLMMCTNAGMYILQLMDNYCASFSACIIGFTEITVIAYVYGADRWLDDVKVMLGDYPYPKWLWKSLWCFITPSLILLLLIFSWIDMKPTQYGSYVYPEWATAVGWSLSMFSVSAIPIVAAYKVFSYDGPLTYWQWAKILTQPTGDWGPKLQVHRMETHSPKHTDSQVPLAGQFEDNDSNSSDDIASSPRYKGRYMLPTDDPSDSDTGLRLKIPSYGETNF